MDMKIIKHFLIIFCYKKALKYNNLMKMLLEVTKFEHTYAIGLMVTKRNIWLNRARNFLKKTTKK